MTIATARPAAPAAGLAASTGAVLAYERLSKFKERGTGTEISRAVARQTEDNDAAAEARGLPAPVHYVDDGISASRFGTKRRDGWEDLLDAIRAGGVDWVVVWLIDRATRQTRDVDDLLDACREHGTRIIQSGSNTTIDPNDPDAVTLIKISGVLAEAEIAKMSKRQRRAHEALAKSGQRHGGRRPFGYTRDMQPEPREAEAIADAMARILNGESIASITRRWNEAGVLTTGGKEHTSNNVAKMLKRRYLVGVRTHKGTDYPGAWPAIVDDTTHAAVCRVLAGNKPAGGGYTGARAYALSGVLLCGVCGGKMYGRPTPLKSGPAYVCRDGQHTQAPVNDVDGTVRAAIVRRLSDVNASGVFVPEIDRAAAEARQAERHTLAGRLDELADALADGVSPVTIGKAEARLTARLAELDAADAAEADAMRRPQRVLDGLAGMPEAETAAAFDALPVDRQRAVIAVLGVPYLDRGGRGGRGIFDPRRVRFEWLDDADDDA